MGAPIPAVRTRLNQVALACVWCERLLRPQTGPSPSVAALCESCIPAALDAADQAAKRLDSPSARENRG